jgi:hypothetical protein
MLRIAILTITIILTIIGVSCKSDNISAGIKGNLNYGEGNCSLDQSFWYYTPYNGYIYFIDETIKDTISTSYNSIILYADSCLCTNGSFVTALNPGNYFLFIKEYPTFGNNQKFTVFYNQITENDFYIYRCM